MPLIPPASTTGPTTISYRICSPTSRRTPRSGPIRSRAIPAGRCSSSSRGWRTPSSTAPISYRKSSGLHSSSFLDSRCSRRPPRPDSFAFAGPGCGGARRHRAGATVTGSGQLRNPGRCRSPSRHRAGLRQGRVDARPACAIRCLCSGAQDALHPCEGSRGVYHHGRYSQQSSRRQRHRPAEWHHRLKHLAGPACGQSAEPESAVLKASSAAVTGQQTSISGSCQRSPYPGLYSVPQSTRPQACRCP
jgi:hypothetical protein